MKSSQKIMFLQDLQLEHCQDQLQLYAEPQAENRRQQQINLTEMMLRFLDLSFVSRLGFSQCSVQLQPLASRAFWQKDKSRKRNIIWYNPNVSLRLPSVQGLRKKNAFHLMRLHSCSVFSINLHLYSVSDGMGISLVELLNLVNSIIVGTQSAQHKGALMYHMICTPADKVLNSRVGLFGQRHYCNSEFHAPCEAIIRQLPKIPDTYEDKQNLKMQKNAYR